MNAAPVLRLRRRALGAIMLAVLFVAPCASAADSNSGAPSTQTSGATAANDTTSNGVELLKQFDAQQNERVKGASALTDQNKRVIMFSMSLPLFILLLITGGLGIATGVYGKKLYIPHMIFAGLTVTLALAHAIAGIVWFFPF